jgi:hypothetical protein
MKWIAGNLVSDAHECPYCSQLLKQNRELHDRLLAVYAPTVAQTLPAMPSFQVDYRGPVGVENPSHNTPPVTQPVELPGTQVEGGE